MSAVQELKEMGVQSLRQGSPRGGQGKALQYSCLKNPMDRGAWWATVHRIAKSWTRLKRLRMHTPHKYMMLTVGETVGLGGGIWELRINLFFFVLSLKVFCTSKAAPKFIFKSSSENAHLISDLIHPVPTPACNPLLGFLLLQEFLYANLTLYFSPNGLFNLLERIFNHF